MSEIETTKYTKRNRMRMTSSPALLTSSGMTLWRLLVVLLLSACAADALTTVGSPRCEYRVNPLGIDSPNPRLSWIIQSDQRGEQATAYQVLVASSPQLLVLDQGDLWNSGKVLSNNGLNVAYAGSPLVARQACYWKIRIWDHADTPSGWSPDANWSMGLLSPADWQAQWISDAVLADPGNRPLTPVNCYRSTLTTDPAAAKWIVLDLGSNQTLNGVDLLAARPASQNGDFRTFMFPLRFKIETATAADFSSAQTVMDQTGTDYALNPRSQRCHFAFANVTARYVRLSVTKLSCWDGQDYGLALAGLQVLNGSTQLALNVPVTCSDSMETALWSKSHLVDGLANVAIAADSPALAANVPGVSASHSTSRVPMLRREFALPEGIQRAVLSVSARGLYEVRINGQRVGDELLAPGYTAYSDRLQYQTHDVTDLLQSGTNAIGALLGYGWFAGHMNLSDNRCLYGTFPQFIAQLDVELANGQWLTIATDGNWRGTLSGPVRFSDLLDGEGYDCRLELPGWDSPGFNDAAWTSVWTQPRDNTPLVWQRCQPIQRIQDMQPVAVNQVSPGAYVYDFGQEISGWCRLVVNGPAGTHITLRHAEVVNPGGTINVANLWGTSAQEDYFLDGLGERTLEPHFTYHGFRYVEVTGLPQPPATNTLVAVHVRSALPEVGDFTCSSPLFNRIMSAARWTQRNLLFDVPAGVAARSERLAWLGDVRPCVQAACFNFDAAGFLAKYAQDIRDAQAGTRNGRYCDISPHAPLNGTNTCVGSPGWADAGVSLPWEEYVNYDDLPALAAHYASAKQWVDYVAAQNPNFIWQNSRGMDWGDWLSAGPATPNELGSTAFFAHSADLVARMASVLGQTSDAAKYRTLFTNIKQAFVQKYVSAAGVIAASPGSADGATAQGNYALALSFGLLDEPLKSLAVSKLMLTIKQANGHPTIGFWSTAGLLLALSANGHHLDADRMLGLESAPSWGYMVNHGTTFWESFDADTRNLSLDHWTHSSVGEWLWRDVAGLNPDENNPSYKSFKVQPRASVVGSWSNATYNSMRGPIVVNWQRGANLFTLDLTVPVTASAIVYLPTAAVANVSEGGNPATAAAGVQWLRQEGAESVFQVGSGTYHFTVTNAIWAEELTPEISPTTASMVVGDPITFTAAFVNAAAITYQWQFTSGGVTTDIPGATGPTLTLANLQLSNTGSYRLKAVNGADSQIVAYSAESSLVVSNVPAAVSNVITTCAAQTGQPLSTFTPAWDMVTNGDLIHGQNPASAIGNFNLAATWNGNRNVNSLTAGDSLAIGQGGSPVTTSTNYVTCGNGSGAGSSVTYSLAGSASGYDLARVMAYGGWKDAGRDQQAYTVYYSKVSDPATFILLGSVNYNPANAASVPCATLVTLTPASGALATNVAAVKFDFTSPASENGYCGYAEIGIFGSVSVPVPTTTTTHQGADEIVTFTASSTWTPPAGVTSAQVLVVGGGGGGGAGTGGGGGAGGFIYKSAFDVSSGTQTVIVGGGGAGGTGGPVIGHGSNGSNSTFGSLTAVGGGGGANNGSSSFGGQAGGSGGGSSGGTASGGIATSGQGNVGGNCSNWGSSYYAAGGGGGAGAAGANGSGGATGANGGDGLSSSISGILQWYAAGGGGGEFNTATGGAGGSSGSGGHGGGSGGSGTTSGAANTGSGGGGQGGNSSAQAGSGGSGIVIVRYPSNDGTIPSTFYWINADSAGWGGTANWNDGSTLPVAAGQADYTLNFNTAETYTATNDLASGFLLNRLNFGAATVTLAGNSLKFTGNGATLPQVNQNGSAAVAVGNDLYLDANTTVGGSGNGTVILGGAISGSGGLT